MTKHETPPLPAGGTPVERPVGRLEPERADVAAVMAMVWSLVRSGPNFDGRQVDVQRAVTAAIDNAAAAERQRWEDALRLTWQMVDRLKPAGEPGSYWRGQDAGIVAALNTLRANLKPPNAEVTGLGRNRSNDD